MKHSFCKFFALFFSFLSVLSTITPSLASTSNAHANISWPSDTYVSSWAKDSVDKAVALDLVPHTKAYNDLLLNIQSPICRRDFFSYITRFIALQQGCDEANFVDAVCYYQGNSGGNEGAILHPDELLENSSVTALLLLDVIQEQEIESLDAESIITRQEAATVIARTYQLYGGEFTNELQQITFLDEEEIAFWAKESTHAMKSLGVMIGCGDGRFAPKEPLSYEECLVSLIRLYEKAPISRKNGNISPLFSYRQYIAVIEAQDEVVHKYGAGMCETLRVIGRYAAFSKSEPYNTSEDTLTLRFVYSFGAMKTITDLGICNTGMGHLSKDANIVNPYFSRDGKTFYCTLVLDEAIPDYADTICHGHEAGTYLITVDVDSCQSQVTKQA